MTRWERGAGPRDVDALGAIAYARDVGAGSARVEDAAFGCVVRLENSLTPGVLRQAVNEVASNCDRTRKRVLVILDEMPESLGIARDGLVEFHAELARDGVRTAYVAAQPRYRGLVLYALRMNEDEAGSVFATEGAAKRWLELTDSRFEVAVNDTMALLRACQQRLADMDRGSE